MTTSPAAATNPLAWTDRFLHRHIGPNAAEAAAMLRTRGFPSLDALNDTAVPADAP